MTPDTGSSTDMQTASVCGDQLDAALWHLPECGVSDVTAGESSVAASMHLRLEGQNDRSEANSPGGWMSAEGRQGRLTPEVSSRPRYARVARIRAGVAAS
jgi:hypothetical protein